MHDRLPTIIILLPFRVTEFDAQMLLKRFSFPTIDKYYSANRFYKARTYTASCRDLPEHSFYFRYIDTYVAMYGM